MAVYGLALESVWCEEIDGPASSCVSSNTYLMGNDRARKPPGYCWSFYFHAIRLLLLYWILMMFGPSTQACRGMIFGTWGLTNSIRPLNRQDEHLHPRASQYVE